MVVRGALLQRAEPAFYDTLLATYAEEIGGNAVSFRMKGVVVLHKCASPTPPPSISVQLDRNVDE